MDSQISINYIFSDRESLHSLTEAYESVIFYDTETTGLSPYRCNVTELAALRIAVKEDCEVIEDAMDCFVRLPEGRSVPPKIVQLTGITDELLEEEGIEEEDAVSGFMKLFSGRTLLVAHNAAFDIAFVAEMIKRHGSLSQAIAFSEADHLDTLTVLKDRKSYPHRLCSGIEYYGLDDAVCNTHRAIDDVTALYAMTRKLAGERDDLAEYVNIFGYNPKYGLQQVPVPKIRFLKQPYTDGLQSVPFMKR